jgi:NifB/MoaA-like Fe-S oxidoreductase
VPVGLTGHRENLEKIKPFNKETSTSVIEIIDRFGDECVQKYGERRVYAADEFYILAEKELPDAHYYGDFLQLENGVGLVPLLLSEVEEAIENTDYKLEKKRIITMVTGEAAFPFISQIVDKIKNKWDNLECKVIAIKNNFFGGEITVAGLVTATDIKEQLKGVGLGEELLIPSVMLSSAGDMFLDSITVDELSNDLSVKITAVDNDGYDLLEKGRFACLIIGDKYANSQHIPLGFECMARMNKLGFITKAIIIKDMQGNERAKGKTANLWRYRALAGGFYIFKHEYVMVFQKV